MNTITKITNTFWTFVNANIFKLSDKYVFLIFFLRILTIRLEGNG